MIKTLTQLDTFAGTHPDRIALFEAQDALSFKELRDKSRALACFYHQQGLREGDIVACLKTTAKGTFISALGALYAGLGFIILDQREDQKKLKNLLSLAQIKRLIVEGAYDLGEDFPTTTLREAISGPIIDLPEPSPDALGYIEPTSGSTGSPKLVPITQAVMQHYIDLQVASAELTPQDRVALLGELWMDTVLSGLNAGVSMHAFDFREKGAVALVDWLRAKEITTLQTYPAAFRAMCEASDDPFPHLNKVRLAGEILTSADIETFERVCLPGSKLSNYYGSTECSFVTCFVHAHGDANEYALLPVGSDIPGTTVSIEDETGQALPDGAKGQIVVRAAHMAKGYLNNPDKTKGVYWQEANGVHVWNTGDLGYRDAKGRLHIVGRSDDQVKIRGYSVRYAEVEEAIAKLPDIAKVCVTSTLSHHGTRQLVAHVVAQPGIEIDARSVKSQIARQYPAYMVPNYIIPHDVLPMTPSGKVHRKALPDPLQIASGANEAPTEWPTQTTKELADIWQRILGHDQFGIDDDFFDVGGDSLQAMSMVLAIERSLKKRVGYESLIIHGASIESIAARLEKAKKGDAADADLVTLKSGSSRAPLYILPVENGEFSNWLYCNTALSAEQSVMGVHVRDPNQRRRIARQTTQELAEVAANSIRAHNPDGPYFVAGYSASTFLAIETARVLQDKGGAVAGVILIDPPVRQTEQEYKTWHIKRVLSPLMKSKDLTKSASRAGHLILKTATDDLEFADEVVFWRYRPTKLNGITTLIAFAQDDEPSVAIKTEAWEPLFAPKPEIWSVAGYHNTVLRDPHAGILAPQLENWIKQRLNSEA